MRPLGQAAAGYAADSITAQDNNGGEEKPIEHPIELVGYGSLQERVKAVKTKYDRENFFQMNQNIVPEETAVKNTTEE